MRELKILHTPNGLLNALAAASSAQLSYRELFEQRISFIYGSIDGSVTRDRIRKVLEEGAGVEAWEAYRREAE